MQASHANMNALYSCTFTFPWHWVLKQPTLIVYLRSKNGLCKPAVGQLCFLPAATASIVEQNVLPHPELGEMLARDDPAEKRE